MFKMVLNVLGSSFNVTEKDAARALFNSLQQEFKDMNYSEFQSEKFKTYEKQIAQIFASNEAKISDQVKALLKEGE